jgi:hypothetical protein
MKRTYRFVEPSGFVTCTTEDGEHVELPVVAGILKHPTLEQLARLLEDPVVARKYTHEALRRAPWSAVRRFPRAWLLAHLAEATLPEGRRRALELMLDVSPASGPGD